MEGGGGIKSNKRASQPSSIAVLELHANECQLLRGDGIGEDTNSKNSFLDHLLVGRMLGGRFLGNGGFGRHCGCERTRVARSVADLGVGGV
jgi:hypothetical protein